MKQAQAAELESFARSRNIEDLAREIRIIHPDENRNYFQALCSEVYRRIENREIDPSYELVIIEATRKWLK